MKKVFISIASFVLLMACNSRGNSGNADNSNASVAEKVITAVTSAFNSITPPPKAAAPAAETIALTNSEGTVTKTQRGTVVIVPKDAFVFEDGSTVNGKVDLKIVEIFTAAEIILSGIPMNVDHNGKTEPFISDGMFKVAATADNKPLALAKGKSITICNESHKENKDFDYWYFDEKKGRWDNLGNRGQTADSKQVMTIAESSNPAMTVRYQAYQAETDNAVKKRVQRYTGPMANLTANDKGVSPQEVGLDGDDFVFSLNANDNAMPELASYKNVIWKTQKNLTTDQENQLVADLGKANSNVLLKCIDPANLVYDLNYLDKSIKIQPVLMDGGKKAREQFAQMQKNYEKALSEKKDKELQQKKLQNTIKTVYNVFQVMSLGIYNCDRFYNSGKKPGFYNLVCNSKKVDNYVYAILNNREGVVCLSEAYLQEGRFRLPIGDVKGFIHVADDGQLYSCKNTPSDKDHYDLKLEPTKFSADNGQDLEYLINSF